MKKRTKKKLSRKMAAICTVFALTISVTLGVMGFYTYYHNILEQYRLYIRTILSLAEGTIQVEDMMRCIGSGEKSSQYEKTQKELDNLKSRSQ